MKIGIDISQTAYQGTGVARYTTSLLKGLMKYDTKNEYLLFFSSLRQPVPEEIKKIINKNTTLKTFKIPPSVLDILWNKIHRLSIEKLIGSVDIFITSDWTEPPAKKAKKITIIHDLVVYKFPETSDKQIVETQKMKLERVRKESKLIAPNSQATKNDIKEILQISDEKLRVIYPGVDIELDEKYRETFEKKYDLKRPYILTVGTLQPRKNIKRLVEAFGAANLEDIDLYIVGMQGWGDQTLPVFKNVKQLGYVPDQDLPYLYKNAEFFIYPALYEGFGFPIIEAMKMGCPVATSDTSSVKELADGYGLLFDPYSIKSITEAIQKLHSDKRLRDELAEKGLKRAEDFTIKKFAEGFIQVFNELS